MIHKTNGSTSPSARPIRVLEVIDTLALGGAQTFLLNFLRALREYDIVIDVAALHGPGVFSNEFEALGGELTHLGTTKFNLALPWRLRQQVRQGDYDIVHAHLVASCFICERLRGFLGIRRLISHLQLPYRHQEDCEYQNFLEMLSYRKSEMLLTCSREVLESVPRSTPAKVVYNCIDETRFRPREPEEVATIRGELNFSKDDYVVGFIGRLVERKDPALVIRAGARLRDEIPGLKILIVGSGPLESSLRRLVTELGMEHLVTFTGFQSDVERYLTAMDAFVIASTFEGLGLTLVEAMACGVPCLASDYDTVHEVMTTDQEGLIFERGNVETLIRQMRRYYQDPQLRRHCTHHARQRVETTFTSAAVARQVAEIYRGLL